MVPLSKLNVLHVNASDSIGGAAKACIRLHESMLSSGIISKVLVQRKTSSCKNVYNLSNTDQFLFSKIRRRLNSYITKNVISDIGSFTPNGIGRDITNHKAFKDANVIYLHYINSGFLNTKSVLKILKKGKPVIWFLHDMWPFTGGCHHSFDCDKYKVLCLQCPNLIRPHEFDLSRKVFEPKIEIVKYTNLSIVAPSSWLSRCSADSRLFGGFRNENIPNTLHTNVFYPEDIIASRQEFNLPTDKKLILFGAVDAINNPYKGWEYLVKAINSLCYNKDEVQLVIFGSDGNSKIKDSFKYKTTFVGYISDDEILNKLYNAVDVFLLPSLADNFPNTLLESLFCGTPCVGFDVGGVGDLVVTGTTGYLAKPLDSDDLAQGICEVLDNLNLTKEDIITFAVSHFGHKIVVDKHVNLIRNILEG